MIRVLLAENYPIVRHGLKQVLTETLDIWVVGNAMTRHDLLQKARTSNCHVLILDALLHDAIGLDLVFELQHTQPSLAVLILSLQMDIEVGMRALKAGASGHITINSTPEEFIKAVRTVADGRKYVNPDLAEALALGLQQPGDQPRHHGLSEREYQVLSLFGIGKTLTEIAQMLTSDKATIAPYRRRILKKLHLKSSEEIVRYAVEHRLAC